MTNEDNTADGRISNWTLATVTKPEACRVCSCLAQERVMKNESPEYRRLSDGSIWVFIEGRGWTFLRVERSAGAQTVTVHDGSGELTRN
jgi:hypothetical protein